MAKGKEPDRRLEAQWRRIIRQHIRSGLTIREFCGRSKLPESAFYFWRRELTRRDLGRPKQDKERRNRPPARGAFVPVRLAVSNAEGVAESPCAEVPARIEIVLSGGRRVHVTAPVDRAALADVLAVLSLDFGAGWGEGRPC